MAIHLKGEYSKKLGLPGYSSHQFSASIQAEITDPDHVPAEVARLYRLLQGAVDREIQQPGFIPGPGYGQGHQPGAPTPPPSLMASPSPTATPDAMGDGHVPPQEAWACTPRQRALIGHLATELQLSAGDLDARSRRLLLLPIHQLDKGAASALIGTLLTEANVPLEGRGTRPAPQREGRRGKVA